MENDTSSGGEPLSIDEAVKVLVKAEAAEALEDEHVTASAENGPAPGDPPLDHDPEQQRPADTEPDDGSESEEGDDEGEPEDELADAVQVKLDDGSVVTLAELKKGHLRQADYTKKTQALASERRTVERLRPSPGSAATRSTSMPNISPVCCSRYYRRRPTGRSAIRARRVTTRRNTRRWRPNAGSGRAT